MSLLENVLIILTCTVNVNKLKFCVYQSNPNDRLKCYSKSIKQWLELTNLNICVVENSGYTFPELSEYTKKYKDRFEILTFNELNLTGKLADLNSNPSKGASEIFAILYAQKNTKFNTHTNFIIKITGRYFIPDLQDILIKLNINTNTKNVGIRHNNDMIIGLRQSDHSRCEIIGIHMIFFNLMFWVNLYDNDNNFVGHVEDVYRDRFKLLNQDNIINLPTCKIEPTQMGGLAQINTEL
jgi:hypothetical protein